ncbi:hypothetical protein BKA93DRAFT_553974 [Sparassis latifolia]
MCYSSYNVDSPTICWRRQVAGLRAYLFSYSSLFIYVTLKVVNLVCLSLLKIVFLQSWYSHRLFIQVAVRTPVISHELSEYFILCAVTVALLSTNCYLYAVLYHSGPAWTCRRKDLRLFSYAPEIDQRCCIAPPV